MVDSLNSQRSTCHHHSGGPIWLPGQKTHPQPQQCVISIPQADLLELQPGHGNLQQPCHHQMILWAIWSTPYMAWQEGLDPHMSSSRPRQGGYIPGLQRRTRKRFQEAHQMTQSHTSYLQLTGTVQTSGRSLMCQSKHLPYPSCYLNSEWWPPDSLQ